MTHSTDRVFGWWDWRRKSRTVALLLLCVTVMFSTTIPVHAADAGIKLVSWSAEVGADRGVTITIVTADGGGLQSFYTGQRSIVGFTCEIASTGEVASGTAMSFGGEYKETAPDTYMLGPTYPSNGDSPELRCYMDSASLYGNDGSSVRYSTREDFAAANLALTFSIPGNQEPPPTATPLKYVAMGDSYSSGEGNPTFDLGTDTRSDKCHRSSNAWPRILSRLNTSGVHIIAHIACSGATINALTHRFNSEAPQLTQLKALPKADLITLTMGGNDIGFSRILKSCYVAQCDRNHVIDSAVFNLERPNGLIPALTKAIRSIKQVQPSARVVVVGYPNIFPTSQSSAVNCGWLTEGERQGLVRLASVLDTTSQSAAKTAGADYVSTLGVLSGHESCTTDSWMVPIGPFTGAQLQQNGHPLATGQFAIASAVQDFLNR